MNYYTTRLNIIIEPFVSKKAKKIAVTAGAKLGLNSEVLTAGAKLGLNAKSASLGSKSTNEIK